MAVPFHTAIPRYQQIAQLLRQRAGSGELGAAGGRATEQALCEEFGVSRTTVRHALASLKREGLLRSRRGVGTALADTRPRPAYTRFSGDPLHAALGSRPRVVSLGRQRPPQAVREFLGLGPQEPALRLVRTHELDGAPLSVVVTWLPPKYAAGVTRAALARDTLHRLLLRLYRLRLKRSTHTLRVARADAFIAAQLGIAFADPVLYIRSQAVDARGRPVRWSDNYFREDRYQYSARMNWGKELYR